MTRNRRPRLEQLEVDMVPFIDIVTLLLMFLIIVGDMAKSAAGVKQNRQGLGGRKPPRG